ncbi:MAG: PaaI family thioesterase [Bacteroidetes bacterium]|nr:PaaI family thioesterase [Bacteroidota bacterium]MBM3455087.1 PaaI family thioesterase [Bacteroidota bacterium]
MILKQVSLSLINSKNKNTLMEVLGIECIELGLDYIKCLMPVDQRTHQPMGLLHGGASAALIESIGSMGSSLMIDLEKFQPVGLEVNCNHISGITDGFVIGTGKIIHAGKRTHVWSVNISEANTDRLICTGRLTVLIIEKK